MPNRLASESSPYLLQHAHNPVDWYPWGTAAIERARVERRPILLSVGYSACHWCHVMERESFEDDDTAALMNELFVNVKVDREERPDVDGIYMQAVQAMTGHGGWPMTVFLTPELVPFWGGTYFPPEDRHGMPSFRRVLRAVADAWESRPDDVQRVAASMRQMYAGAASRARSGGALSPDVLDRAERALLADQDPVYGGFGGAPKFPQSMAMEFLLQRWARTGSSAALDAVASTFDRMRRGGIYDQVGGGFARYAVDERWLVPHFEKMLYDNALLVRLGVHLWQATGSADCRRVCEETLTWLEREMTSPAGAFYSAMDADSEGHEGRFYVWSADELRRVLGADAEAVMGFWGVSEQGNFEGANILHVASTDGAKPDGLERARAALYEARAKRVWPARDEKVLASWNGLMLRAVAEAARAFDSRALRSLALANGEFLFREMVRDGRVLRAHRDGTSRIAGFLEDYAAICLGALALYELTFERVWLERARALEDAMVTWFWDDESGAFFDTARDHEELVTRPRDITDNATPSGTSLAAEALLRLGHVLGDADMMRRGGYVLETMREQMARFPLAFGHALTAADIAVHGATEVALAGDKSAADFQSLASVLGRVYVPSVVVAGGAGEGAEGISVLEDQPPLDGRATAYVCRGFTCSLPLVEPDALRHSLSELKGVAAQD